MFCIRLVDPNWKRSAEMLILVDYYRYECFLYNIFLEYPDTMFLKFYVKRVLGNVL